MTKINNKISTVSVNNTISAFSQITYSTKSFDVFTIEDTLNAIKTGVLKTRNGVFALGSKTNQARNAGKGSAIYNTIKTKQIPCVTWASEFSSNRKKDGDFTFSGALFFDVDEFKEGQGLEQAKADIITIPCVKAVWKSLSGKGLGGIIYAEGYELGYFLKLAELLNDKGYQIDIAVKDLQTRLNVLSYDKDIIIKSDAEVTTLNEIVESKPASLSTYYINKSNSQSDAKLTNISLTNGSDAHRKAYTYATKTLRYIKGQRNAFITKYAGMTNQFGLSFADMSKEIIKVHPDFDLKRAEDIYKRYANQFGTLSTVNQPAIRLGSEKLVLKVTQRLSDILDESYLGKSIVAPVGSGKSYFIGKKITGKRIMVVPTQTLSSEFAEAYDGKEFNEFSKSVSDADDLIFVTYASFANLCNYISLEKYNVVLDEVHLFSTGSSRGFMYKQLNSTLDILKERKQRSTTLLTATPVASNDEFLNSFEEVTVTSESTKPKSWTTITSEDRLKTVQSIFDRAAKEGGFVSVLLNNTKSQLDSFLGALQSYNIQVFSAAKKGETYFVDLISTGNVEKDVDGFISTTVLGQGNSFRVGKGRNATNFVVVLGNHSVETIEQFGARIRDAKEVEVFHIVGSGFKSNKNVFFNYDKKVKELTEVAQFRADYYNKMGNVYGGFYSVEQMNLLNQVEETCLKLVDGEYMVDDLLISNAVYKYETYVTNKNVEYLEEKIKAFNYTYNGVQADFNELSEEDGKKVKARVEDAKTKRKELVKVILDDIKAEGLEHNHNVLNSSVKLDNIENNIRFRLDYIFKYEKDENKVFEIYEEVAQTDKSWGVFKNRVLITKILTDSNITERSDRKLVEAIYKEFSVKEVLTAEETNTRLCKVVARFIPKVKKMSKTKTTQLLKTFFEVKTKRVKIDGVDYRKSEIVAKFKLSLDIDTDRLESPIKYTPKIKEQTVPALNFGLFA